MEKRTVGERGQIVLPKHIREKLSLKPGRKMVFELKRGMILLKPEEDSRRFVEEFVSVPRKMKKIRIGEIKKALDEEYEVR